MVSCHVPEALDNPPPGPQPMAGLPLTPRGTAPQFLRLLSHSPKAGHLLAPACHTRSPPNTCHQPEHCLGQSPSSCKIIPAWLPSASPPTAPAAPLSPAGTGSHDPTCCVLLPGGSPLPT